MSKLFEGVGMQRVCVTPPHTPPHSAPYFPVFPIQAAGDTSGAFDLYRRALLLHPTSPELLSNLGWLEEQRGGGSRESLETAAQYYERAMKALEADSAARGQIEINLANVHRLLLGGSGG